MPRVAALLDVMQISDIIAVVSPDTFVRPIYAGNALATVQSHDPIKVITVRAPPRSRRPATAASAPIERSRRPATAGLSELPGRENCRNRPARADLGPDRRLRRPRHAVGRELHDLSSRSPTSSAPRWAPRAPPSTPAIVPNDYQVGQTGKIVAPELYIAVGISGAIQHLAGMKDRKVIVAINKDEEAPIFQVADYGLVGDLFKILPELKPSWRRLAVISDEHLNAPSAAWTRRDAPSTARRGSGIDA